MRLREVTTLARALTTLAVAVLLSSCGSGQREVDLNGSVFIVKQNGESVKLALAEVGAFPASGMQPLLEARREHRNARGVRRESSKGDVFAELEDLGRQVTDATKEVTEADARVLESMKQTSGSPEDYFMAIQELDEYMLRGNSERAFALIELWVKYEEAVESLHAKGMGTTRTAALLDMARQLLWSFVGDLCFRTLPSPMTVTRTDADGRFSMRLAKGERCVLAAHARQTRFGIPMGFYWLVWVTPGSAEEPIMLSNHNMVGAGHSDSVLVSEF